MRDTLLDTASLTGSTQAKGQTDTTGAKQVSDFFYATIDSEDSNKVLISSLLPSDDGANCSIYLNGSSSYYFCSWFRSE